MGGTLASLAGDAMSVFLAALCGHHSRRGPTLALLDGLGRALVPDADQRRASSVVFGLRFPRAMDFFSPEISPTRQRGFCFTLSGHQPVAFLGGPAGGHTGLRPQPATF